MEFIKVLNNEKDIYSLSRLATEIVREHYDPIIGKEQNDYMLKKFQSVEGIKSQFDNGYEYYFLYLKDENQNIGFIGLCEEKKKLFLSKFYIKKEHRNKGYGKQAFEFIKNLAIKCNKESIYLTVNRNNTVTIQKYYRLGLKKVEERKTDIGKGYYMDDYILEYNIEC